MNSVPIIDIVEYREEPGRTPKIYCSTKGCFTHTTGGKPHCSSHVFSTSYATKLLEQLEAQEKEEKQLSSSRRITMIQPDSARVQDIINYLKDKGPRSVAAIARGLHIKEEIAPVYVRYLVRKGIVVQKKNRGAILVALIS